MANYVCEADLITCLCDDGSSKQFRKGESLQGVEAGCLASMVRLKQALAASTPPVLPKQKKANAKKSGD